jgi:dolichyl-phosphate-mannose--protein O-mannosyl transferase
MVYFLGNTSWWVYTGVIIMTVEMIATAAFAWYRNSLKKWGNVQSNSYNYILAAIKKLKYRKFLMIYVMPMYGLLLITGINLVYIDVISELSSTLRWVIHLSVSGILAVFFIVQIARRLKKERREIDPLIEELQAMKEGLE